jgi:IS5 family transposase
MADDELSDEEYERVVTKLRAALKGGRSAGYRRKLLRFDELLRQRQPLNPVSETPSVDSTKG